MYNSGMRVFVVISLLVALIGVGIFVFYTRHYGEPAVPSVELPSQEVEVIEATVATPEISFGYPKEFGLAVTQEQILVTAYIPPCSEGFDYCLYYNAHAYDGTNFESAGVRVKRRADLNGVTTCLTKSPEGYDTLTPTLTVLGPPSVSRFSPLGDAGAGHYAEGILYRLWDDSTCFEFETRIGASQYANYAEGSIEEFTDGDRDAVEHLMRQILNSVTLTKTGEKVAFPE